MLPAADAGAAGVSELNDVSLRLDDLAAGRRDALTKLRNALHLVVASPTYSGTVKTAIVQAMLLLDDPRIAGGQGGTSLLAKIRKLVIAARDAHAEGPAAPQTQSSRIEFSPDALLSPETDRGLVEEFVLESREQLEIAESALLALDGDPDDMNALDALFRALHTIKGTSAFLGVEHATELAHHAESLLSPVRAGSAVCSGELSSLVFRSIDMLDAMLVSIERAADGETAMLPDGFRPLLKILRDGPGETSQAAKQGRASGQMRRLRFADTSVRVRSTDLDRLMGVVRELVLTHSMLSRDNALRAGVNQELGRKIAHAERLAFELEEVATELRTVAFAPTMQKLARLTRDVAYQSGKSIELVTEGEDILVERAMVDALADPLLHMVRNAIDHGIESADERRRAGKSESGQLRIVAQRLGTQLVIEIRDDGRGMSPDELVRKAVERGIVSPDATLSDQEAFGLIFRPGFSTSAVVTELSGRGVGMDVVRTNVEAVGGSIEIASRVGYGTTFTIRLPFRSQPARSAPPSWVDAPRTIGLIA
ncbi:MAG TPA: ATP-binding protein [Gemmatimonadaceae bacterium]|jgi:two-component system chemotaxis sensor kinase CheA